MWYTKINDPKKDVWDTLDEIVTMRLVMLNRAPSLHINSMQAFQIRLVDGYAIRIHPLICEGYNAELDGDQMAVYLNILPSSTIEAKILMQH
jgi:DNA-directed RNA polymerase subunit beta'